LTILLETPGEIVSRDHLRLQVWKGETFVEFDRAINKAIARIRRSLGDTSAVCRRESRENRGKKSISTLRNSQSRERWQESRRAICLRGNTTTGLRAGRSGMNDAEIV
jgi:Transcriptional regulatory protein, C terminal